MGSGVQPKMFSTVRGYQLGLRMFCDYLIDDRYGWVSLCANRFGAIPTQVLHEWNSVSHVSEFEGRPGRRALTYDEVAECFYGPSESLGFLDDLHADGMTRQYAHEQWAGDRGPRSKVTITPAYAVERQI
ncbi:hypothetical protein [Nocardia sp. CA-135398]|uniref:hypothetical protein n=1 Tax=Nocardia sp. CA-135398 TaxID=3239977 RepID=UPI003D994901